MTSWQLCDDCWSLRAVTLPHFNCKWPHLILRMKSNLLLFWIQYKVLSFSSSDSDVTVSWMRCDVRSELWRHVVAHQLLLMLLMLLMMFHSLTDAVVATTQRVVATTCHRIESADQKQSSVTLLSLCLSMTYVARVSSTLLTYYVYNLKQQNDMCIRYNATTCIGRQLRNRSPTGRQRDQQIQCRRWMQLVHTSRYRLVN